MSGKQSQGSTRLFIIFKKLLANTTVQNVADVTNNGNTVM